MTQPLTVTQLWALLTGGPIAMILTVLVGILVNNRLLKSEIGRVEGELRADVRRVEDGIRAELGRVEGVLTAKLEALTARVKALEDELHSPLVKR